MDNLIVNFLNRVRELTQEENPIVESNKRKYWRSSHDLVTEPTAREKTVHSLSSIVDYVRHNPDNLDAGEDGQLIINVENADKVKVFSALNEDKNRNSYLSCELFPFGFSFDRFMDPETFIIGVQTYFDPNDDRTNILSYIGNVRDEEIMERKDDGITQELNVKKGISGVDRKVLPNPVKLLPKRVFPEINPIESQFILRARKGQQGVEFALFDSDKEAWRMDAIEAIKVYLYSKLGEAKVVII